VNLFTVALEEQFNEIAYVDIKNEMDNHEKKYREYKNLQYKFFKKVDNLNMLKKEAT
jgi:hypothetical protein